MYCSWLDYNRGEQREEGRVRKGKEVTRASFSRTG